MRQTAIPVNVVLINQPKWFPISTQFLKLPVTNERGKNEGNVCHFARKSGYKLWMV